MLLWGGLLTVSFGNDSSESRPYCSKSPRQMKDIFVVTHTRSLITWRARSEAGMTLASLPLD